MVVCTLYQHFEHYSGFSIIKLHKYKIIILYSNKYNICNLIVSGEANFLMEHTGLTVGGFTQPNIAKGLIESQSNIEKGVCQRFLWIFPKPHPTKFKELKPVDGGFSNKIGKCNV